MAHSALDTQSVVDRYMEACATRGLARGTLYTRRICLRHFLQWLGERDIGELTSEDVSAYAVELAAYRYKRSKAESAPSPTSSGPSYSRKRRSLLPAFSLWARERRSAHLCLSSLSKDRREIPGILLTGMLHKRALHPVVLAMQASHRNQRAHQPHP